jgi:hypothetical protein
MPFHLHVTKITLSVIGGVLVLFALVPILRRWVSPGPEREHGFDVGLVMAFVGLFMLWLGR